MWRSWVFVRVILGVGEWRNIKFILIKEGDNPNEAHPNLHAIHYTTQINLALAQAPYLPRVRAAPQRGPSTSSQMFPRRPQLFRSLVRGTWVMDLPGKVHETNQVKRFWPTKCNIQTQTGYISDDWSILRGIQ